MHGGRNMNANTEYILDKTLSEHLFDNARDILLIISETDGTILKANKAAIDIYGYSCDEIEGMSIYRIRKEDPKVINSQMDSAIKEGILFETVHYKKDGSEIPVEVSSVGIPGKKQGIILSIVRDITERKEKEEKISFSEKRMTLLYESMKEGVSLNEIITDSNNKPVDYRFISANGSFEKFIDIEHGEIIGKTVLEVMPHISKEWIYFVGQVALTGIPEKIEYYDEGKDRYFQFNIYSPKEKFFVVLFSDITELKSKEKELIEKYEELTVLYEELAASEEELKDNYAHMERLKEESETANKAKSLFLANMSHEIRTPLAGIIGTADLLSLTELNEEQGEYVELITESGMHLLDIINNVLDMSKIEAGKFNLDSKEFNLKNNIEKIIKPFSINGAQKGIDVMLYYQPLIDEVVIGDELRLNQVIVNLMGNALKYTKYGTILLKVKQLECGEKRIKLLFSVKDTGIGIKEDIKDKLFKVFSQGDSSYTKKYGGTGLGLAIAKEIVTMMSGDIWYESMEGDGSTFFFTAEFGRRINDNKPEIIAKSYSKLQSCNANLKSVLIAEDNEINLKLVSTYLERKGYNYKSVTNGKQAVEEYINSRTDIILMDLQMPEMNGIEAAKAIRHLEKDLGRHTVIIAMTAYAMEGDKEKCIEAGMDDYISKPIDVELLYWKLNKFMNC